MGEGILRQLFGLPKIGGAGYGAIQTSPQYADDTILVLPVVSSQLIQIKNLILHYADYTGLKVNTTNPFLFPLIFLKRFCLGCLLSWDAREEISFYLFRSAYEHFTIED